MQQRKRTGLDGDYISKEVPMTVTRYPGKSLTVLNFSGRCIHSRNCVLQRPEVFIANAPGPWIDPDAADADSTAATIRDCPSGALAYERHDGGLEEVAPPVNVTRIRENGPLEFHAALDVAGETQHFRATLCRCGRSQNKPYCDGAHVAAGFKASGEPASLESKPLASRNGPLRVMPAPNGPLLVQGNVEICSGTGRTITRTEKTALCRCGESLNKPFCDGSHQRIGFRAP
jgi:CDGSH-type Zn-finger protein/uncharacterized Fe-S cluster protein YjdI